MSSNALDVVAVYLDGVASPFINQTSASRIVVQAPAVDSPRAVSVVVRSVSHGNTTLAAGFNYGTHGLAQGSELGGGAGRGGKGPQAVQVMSGVGGIVVVLVARLMVRPFTACSDSLVLSPRCCHYGRAARSLLHYAKWY